MEDNFAVIWKHIAEQLRAQLSANIYQRWFHAIELVSADENQLTLRVPDEIYQVWIESNYQASLQSAVTAVLGAPRQIVFCIGACTPAPVSLPTVAPVNGHTTAAVIEEAAPAAANGLSSRYSFDTLVVGDNNRVAHAAALAVAQHPGKTYNPLFIHGGSGLGKTHLMHAIGQLARSKRKTAKVIYLAGENFANEFIDAIQNSKLVRFRDKYRKADVLLIDDIHFLAGKDRTQEEFFHTFNTLMDGHKQIVLSSDRPPSEISNLEQRLVTRFEWGMTTELGAPDVETRMAILHKKAAGMKVKIDESLIEFIAQRIRSNVRSLEGALTRVASYTSLNGGKAGTDAIEELLRDILQKEAKRAVTADQIQKKVAEHYDIRIADMTSKRRPANIAFPRQVGMYLMRELTKASLSEIGEAFGGRDHGTVLHAHRLVRERMEKEEKVRQAVAFLERQLNR